MRVTQRWLRSPAELRLRERAAEEATRSRQHATAQGTTPHHSVLTGNNPTNLFEIDIEVTLWMDITTLPNPAHARYLDEADDDFKGVGRLY